METKARIVSPNPCTRFRTRDVAHVKLNVEARLVHTVSRRLGLLRTDYDESVDDAVERQRYRKYNSHVG